LTVHTILDGPAWLYQRYSEFWRRSVLAAGWAMLFVLCDLGSKAFAVEWRIVLAACIWLGGLWKPPVGYALLIAALAYPLYLISIYVMALALAALILSAPVAVRFLPQTWWILAAPLFAPVSLIPLTPFLAGLWWGEAAGAVVGALAALWLKIAAAMSGDSPELWQLGGWALRMPPIYARFHQANSLQTLLRIVEPLSRDSLTLLLHLLQIFSWAAAGFTVGLVAHHLRTAQGRAQGRVAMLSLGPGMFWVWAGYVAVPGWLGLEVPRWFEPRWLPAQVLLSGVIAWLVGLVGQYLERPLLGLRSGRATRPVSAQACDSRCGNGRMVQENVTARKKKKVHDDQDIIMIELD